jgi:DDE superfamily endonuclease
MDTRLFEATGCLPCVVPSPPIVQTSLPNSWRRRRPCCGSERFVSSCGKGLAWSAFCTKNRKYLTQRPPSPLVCRRYRFGGGGAAGPWAISPAKTNRGAGASPIFSPLDHATVKALACEIIFETERPLSRQSLSDLTDRAARALGKPISRSTVWRILHEADLKPWRYEYWIFPRDPEFARKAEVILDLYAGFWQDKPLGANDYIISSDEKTSIQARIRCHSSLKPAPGRPRRVEFEYDRGGALQYLAGWDVRRGYVMGRCEASTGIEPFGRLVSQVMEQEPYQSARQVFWVVDNGSSHRGDTSVRRLANGYPKAILVHTPVHASWLNQVEIYFSKIQRKLLTPNDFADLKEIEERLRLYEELTNKNPRPFNWKFDRTKLTRFLERLTGKIAA